MATGNVYRAPVDSAAVTRKVILGALIVSLAIHVGLLIGFYSYRLEQFHSGEATERLVPRAFNVAPVTIDPKILDNAEEPPTDQRASKPVPDPTKIDIPLDKASFDDLLAQVRATPVAPVSESSIIKENPRVEKTDLTKAISEVQADTEMALQKELDAIRKQIVSDKPVPPSRPLLSMKGDPSKADPLNPANVKGAPGDSAGPRVGLPGFSELDQLISQTGPLQPGTAPIMMPTDVLFGFEEATLQAGAITSLQKLGRLIEKNPDSTFSIEGHTDALGREDYNQTLSEERARVVKDWLVTNMGVDATRVETRGFGESKLLVEPSRPDIDDLIRRRALSREEIESEVRRQKLNRRVEIVISTKTNVQPPPAIKMRGQAP